MSVRSPLGWTQPELPPLPPGEAQRDFPVEVMGGTATYPPWSAPGFKSAWSKGLLPARPPETAPEPLPGTSAWVLLWRAVGLAFGGGGGAIIAMAELGLPQVLGIPLMLAAALLGYRDLVATWPRQQAEWEAGYTSMTGHVGTWRLGRGGRVLATPNRDVPPPGFYPSPYHPGLLQLWNGPGWAPLTQHWWRHPERYFRWPDEPYL